jgi:PTH1 family peptidyl-tRNA hydrolase
VTDYIVSGQGNPGAEHAGQRHNVGFWVIDRLAKRHGVSMSSGRNAFTGRGRVEGKDVVLVKPRTYYNGAGRAVGPLLKREHVPPHNLVVIYDDLDLPEGRVRLRARGSDGGNNGLKSISAALASQDYPRIRIGIGRPRDRGVPTWDPELVVRYVLSQPSQAGREVLEAAVERACDAIEAIMRDGIERAMDVANRAEPPPAQQTNPE